MTNDSPKAQRPTVAGRALFRSRALAGLTDPVEVSANANFTRLEAAVQIR